MLEGEGIHFELNVKNMRLAARGSEIALSTEHEGKSHEVVGSHLLLAVGRRPNSDDLGVDKAGIATDARGFITVDDQLHTSVPNIWALGDVNARGAFTHTAYNDYEIIAANLLDNDPRRVSDRITAYALYTDPPLARIGLSEAEVRKSGRPALIGTMQMSRVGRARERGETQGFMSVLVDATDHTILGAMLFGIEADEVIHSLLDLMAAKVPYTVMQRAMHIHPTVSELLPTLLGDLKPFV
jgi:pyruvate/2-oxoglutarate dehydrogenase complex dihydrolipoamide dehydrogenase (E3) component